MTFPQSIEHLNTDCTCVTLDRDALCAMAEAVVGDPAFCRDLAVTHPHLLSAQPIFLSASHAEQIQAIITAIEAVAALPGYQQAVLAHAPEAARFAPGPIGIFMGYDFHLGDTGPRLIEINTNAGGALINAYLLQAQRMCCGPMADNPATATGLKEILDGFIADFQSEWRRQGRSGSPRTIAIVDETPREQYLYPEFVLFQRLFQSRGIDAFIAAPGDLAACDGGLEIDGKPIDLVYNRLTDFAFAAPHLCVLRAAYLKGSVVVTPNPRAHALYADKSNLALLTDEALLRSWGIGEETLAVLANGIPTTRLLEAANLDELWANRRHLFFKPSSGYGGKATYRGDKLTRKVWEDIIASPKGYIAQDLVQPGTRRIAVDGQLQSLKADLRAYTYAGKVRLMAARIYQGQTTNFRTPGGGFAPVIVSNTNADCRCG